MIQQGNVRVPIVSGLGCLIAAMPRYAPLLECFLVINLAVPISQYFHVHSSCLPWCVHWASGMDLLLQPLLAMPSFV